MEEQEQALGDVTVDTSIGRDLGVSSIDIIHVMVALEDRLNQPLNFDELATDEDGQFRKDLTLGELLAFVLSKAPGGAAAAAAVE